MILPSPATLTTTAPCLQNAAIDIGLATTLVNGIWTLTMCNDDVFDLANVADEVTRITQVW